MKGIVYSNERLYRILMRLIYGRDFVRRYSLVSGCVEKNWSVLDLCCGDCYIKHFLDDSVSYEGRDFNETFVRSARCKGLNVEHCDIKNGIEAGKRYDCVIMMGSLYQFLPEEDKIILRMKEIASKRVIISEPVKNIANSKNKVISVLARALSSLDNEKISSIKRLNLDEVKTIFERNRVSRTIDAGKDFIGVFDI